MTQDALDLVPGRELHDAILRRERINRGMSVGEAIAAVGKGLRQAAQGFAIGATYVPDPRSLVVPPGACVLCGQFPKGSLATEPDVAGLGNLDG